MRRIAAPNFIFSDLFSACVEAKREPARTNLKTVLPLLQQLEIEYRNLAANSQLFQLDKQLETSFFVGAKAELFKLYDERMAKNPSPGRNHYDHILAAGLPRCPYCNHNRPRQLDHVLPKEAAGYPELSLVPINLIPSCSDCNFHKRTHRPTSSNDQFFHPYFESPEHVVWLSAFTEYKPTGELTLLFDTITFQGYDAFSDRVKFQFEKLGLAELYAAQAATSLEDIRYGLHVLFLEHGANTVRERILEDYESFNKSDQNSWKTAMYRCLAQDDQFCSMQWSL